MISCEGTTATTSTEYGCQPWTVLHTCTLSHCKRCGECIASPRVLCNVCREANG